MNWLIGKRSHLSLESKILLYKVVFKPVWTYGIQLWGSASISNINIIQRFQSKFLRKLVQAPWYVRNDVIHNDTKVPSVIEEVKKMFRPEFINRVDEMLVFKNLEKSELRTIVDLLLEGINKRLADMKIVISLSPAAKDFIVQEGTDIVYGARPLKRALQKMIEDEIADMILRNEIKNDVTIKVDIQNDKLNFAVEN